MASHLLALVILLSVVIHCVLYNLLSNLCQVRTLRTAVDHHTGGVEANLYGGVEMQSV